MNKGNMIRSEMGSSNRAIESALKEYKKSVGEVVLITINRRTTIELPASLSQVERDARVEIYKNLHKSKI